MKFQLRRFLSRFLPAPLARLPYRIALTQTRRKAPGEVWPRNSFVLGTFEPFVSDLDLSLFLPDAAAEEGFSTFLDTYRGLRRFFPFLGELNVYSASELGMIQDVVNPYELARDPVLARRLDPKPVRSGAEASVFLVRMAEGDRHNLLQEPRKRMKKWNYHFSTLGIAPLDWNGDVLSQILRSALAPDPAIDGETQDQGVLQLKAVLAALEAGTPLHEMSAALTAWQWCFFPHRFCFKEGPFPPLTRFQEEVFRAQLQWETFGMLTQHRQLGEDFLGHSRRLAKIAGNRYPDVERGLRYLL